MRSIRGVAAAALILLALPLAVVADNVFGGNAAEIAVHFALGTGFVLFTAAVFDFGLPRWATWVGAASGAALAGIFLLQGVSGIVNDPAVESIAFGVLGHEVERVLPDVVFVWFVALLLMGSTGKTRLVGWVIMPVVIGLEVAVVIGGLIGVELPFVKLAFVLPFVWLLIESVKAAPAVTPSPRVPRSDLGRAVSA